MRWLAPLLLFFATLPAGAATFTNVGSIGTDAGLFIATSRGWTTSATLEAGNLGVCIIAKDEATTGTSNGDLDRFTSVTNSAGNTWVEDGEFCNANTSNQTDGACVAVYHTVAKTELTSGGTITTTVPVSLFAYAMSCEEFTPLTSRVRKTAGANSVSTDGGDPPLRSVNTGATGPYLFVRATAAETGNSTYTPDSDYTGFTSAVSVGAPDDTSMGVHGDWRIANESTSAGNDPSLGATADLASIIVGFRVQGFNLVISH